MQNKKTIMTFSALFILIFHMWINITNSWMELYLRQLCVIGVDLFFFISAYSISKRKKIEYKKFIIDRFNRIYLKYIVFAVLGFFYLNWKLSKFIKVIFGIELFIKGGGSFLWFIPGIIIVYLVLPLYKKIEHKYPKITPIVMLIVFLLFSILTSLNTNYTAIFILTNRIPIIMFGYYFAKYNIFEYLQSSKIRYWLTTIIALVVGIVISYLVYVNHFYVNWFKDLFYILYIPLIIGMVLLLDKISTNKITNLVGSVTLELYGIQMIFGFKLANKVLTYINNSLLSNIVTIIVLIMISILVNYIFNFSDKIKLLFNK